ncbi:MAG: zinc-dependent alcohol dehydrogenase family protein [Planctomycetota bacterium]
MKSIQFRAPGEPSAVLKCVNDEKPKPRSGEVLVRMLASPVNPSDMMFVRGLYTIPAQCPATPGFEGVGIVEQSGGGLRGSLFRGRRVVVLNRRGGNWAEYTTVPSTDVIPVSKALSDEQAATFFVNPATAWVMTQEVLQIPEGQWLLQSAAGSALGRMIVRLAQHCGFRTFNVVRRESVADELRAMGADHVEVFDNTPDAETRLGDAVRRVIGQSGVRFAIDAVGGQTGSAIVRQLGTDGRVLVYGTLSGQSLEFSPRTLMTVGSKVEGFWLGQFMQQQSLLFKLSLVRRLTKLIQAGILSTEISTTWSLDDISKAVLSSEDPSIRGKTLLRISDR